MRTIHLLGSTAIALVFGSSTAFAQSSTEEYKYDSLGRLISVETVGGQNDDEVHSLCYDKSGNRTEYKATSDGTASTCVNDGSGNAPPPPPPTPPPPPPPPPPSNNPPATAADFASGQCFGSTTVNLTANDSDPEANYPLALTAISAGSGGQAGASIASASSVTVWLASPGDITTFTYTVADSLGATSTGQLTAATFACGGGGDPF